MLNMDNSAESLKPHNAKGMRFSTAKPAGTSSKRLPRTSALAQALKMTNARQRKV